MKWIGISGSWRKTNNEIGGKLRKIVRDIIGRGDGIVSGGALGIDYIALDEALKHNKGAEQIKIFLPTTLEIYAAHYRKHSLLGTITNKQAENLINQLTLLKKNSPNSLIENLDNDFTEKTKKQKYYERNSAVVEASDKLIAFHIKTSEGEGAGTADTIEKAYKKGIPVKIFPYNFIKMH